MAPEQSSGCTSSVDPRWEPKSDFPGVGVLAGRPSGARGRAGSQLCASGRASYTSARLWSKPLPPGLFRECGKVWAFAPSLLLDWEALALWLMEAERAGREEQSLLRRRKRRELFHCSPGLKSLCEKPGAARELRLLSRETQPREGWSGTCRTQGCGGPCRAELGPWQGGGGGRRGRRPGLEPAAALAPRTCCSCWGCVSGAEGPSSPGTRRLPARWGLGRGVSVRVGRGGADAAAGPSDRLDEVGPCGCGGAPWTLENAGLERPGSPASVSPGPPDSWWARLRDPWPGARFGSVDLDAGAGGRVWALHGQSGGWTRERGVGQPFASPPRPEPLRKALPGQGQVAWGWGCQSPQGGLGLKRNGPPCAEGCLQEPTV